MVQNMFVCSRPFEKIEIQAGGNVYFCCPDWQPKPIGNLLKDSLEEAWNSPAARDIRRSIFDGSFQYCVESNCPYLASKSGFVRPLDKIKPKIQALIREKQEILSLSGATLKCSYDRSCNLACPSCRTATIMANQKENEEIEFIQNEIHLGLHEFGALEISGSGDPFASISFRKLVSRIDPVKHRSLKIGIYTNGLLWTRERWNTFQNIHKLELEAEISIDAATAETYALNRRNGKFSVLLENLRFISELRAERKLNHLGINMVVQANNFLEMPEFVKLGKAIGADEINFSKLLNWGSFSNEDYALREIHRPTHAKHRDFLSTLADPILRLKGVTLGNLSAYRNVESPLIGALVK